MTTEPQSQLRSQDQIDKRVPPEIWEQIFQHLYPSQLSRMSMVNSNLNKIVSSLSVWSRMFSVVYGPKKRLRTLRNMPESKSYMLYMCASSFHVCEGCLALVPFVFNPNMPANLQPVLADLPTLSKGEIIYLGEEINKGWMVWLASLMAP
ncbi:hypothetical protein KI688_004975 [Linnemannia hyalina]|uniref:F-box domain-containing protein n=1 Tax=Linnemannia hyalina TaxID=64524 RepID=A0A9P7XNB4_9FUNG|nr:hypothetical protein KI688_004975 [Linnemannia hyalina]